MLATEATKKSGSGGHKWLVVSALLASCVLVCLALWESSPTVGKSEDARSFATKNPHGLLYSEDSVDWQLLLECGRGGQMTSYQVDNTRTLDLPRVVSVYFEPTFGGGNLMTITKYAVQTKRCNYAVKALNKGKELSFVTTADGSFRAQVTKAIADSNWYGSASAKNQLWNSCRGNPGNTRPITSIAYHACGNTAGLHVYPGRCEFDYADSSTRGAKVWVAIARPNSPTC